MTRIVGALILLFSLAAVAAEDNYYERKSEGWFWYKDPPKEEPEEPEAIEEPEPTPPPSESKESDGPERFSVKWFQVNFTKLRDLAIDKPTDENMLAFKIAERVMMDKATKFTEKNVETVLQNPFLDARNVRPLNTASVQVADAAANQNMRSFYKDISDKSAIWFFYSSTCSYCTLQSNALNYVKKIYGYPVYALSVDGNAPPFRWDKDVYLNPDLAFQMGVETTPTMFLVTADGEKKLLSNNMLEKDELDKRMVFFAQKLGLVTSEDTLKTRKANYGEVYFDDPDKAEERTGVEINKLFDRVGF